MILKDPQFQVVVIGVTKMSGEGQRAHGGDQLGKKGQLCRIRHDL